MNPVMGVLNLKELDKFFKEIALTEKEGNSLKLGSIKAAFTPIIKEARSNLDSSVKKRSGNLRKSIGTIGKSRPSGVYVAAGAKIKGKHFHIINSGTSERTTKKGVSRGSVPGFLFFDNAVTKHLGKFAEYLQIAFNARMEKFMKTKY